MGHQTACHSADVVISRPTVELSRRREQVIAERERAPAGSRTEDRPAYAGRLQRVLGG
jgi:hypothetical protein